MLTADAAALWRSARTDPRSRRRAVTVAALGLIVVQLGLRAWAVWGGWFQGDDFVLLSDIARGQDDLGWFFRRYNSVHFMPLGFALVEIVAAAGTWAWHVAATEILVLQAVASLTCWWMLRTLFGNRARILVPLAFYLFCALTIPAMMWWSNSLLTMPIQPAVFIAVTAHVSYLRTRRLRWVAVAGLAVAIGLLAYVKALLIPAVLVALTLTYFASGSFRLRVIAAVRTWWPIWIAYVVLGLTHLAVYFSIGGSPSDGGKIDYSALIEQSVITNLGNGIAGGPWSWKMLNDGLGPRSITAPPLLAQTAALVVLTLVVAYVVVRYRGALRPLWFLLPYAAVSVALLGLGRVSAFGEGVTLDARFWADFVPYLALAVGLMITPVIGSSDPLALRRPEVFTQRMPRTVQGVLAGVFVVGSLYSTITHVLPYHGNFPARAYLTTATEALEAAPAPLDLADDVVPESVLEGLAFPYNKPSLILAESRDHFRTPDVGNDMYVLDGFGIPQLGRARPDLTVPIDRLTECLDEGPLPTRVDLGAETLDYPFWTSISYRADSAMDIKIVGGNNVVRAPILQGRHVLSFRTTGSFSRLTFSLPEGGRMCLDSIAIGLGMVPR